MEKFDRIGRSKPNLLQWLIFATLIGLSFSKIVFLDKKPPLVKAKFDLSYNLLEYIDLEQADHETLNFQGTEYTESWQSYYFRWKGNNLDDEEDNNGFWENYNFLKLEWIHNGGSRYTFNFKVLFVNPKDSTDTSCFIGSLFKQYSRNRFFKMSMGECETLDMYGVLGVDRKEGLFEDHVIYMTETGYLSFPGLKQYIPLLDSNPKYSLSYDSNMDSRRFTKHLVVFRKTTGINDHLEKKNNQITIIQYSAYNRDDPSKLGDNFKYTKVDVLSMSVAKLRFTNCFYQAEYNMRLYCFINYQKDGNDFFKLKRQKIRTVNSKEELLPEFEDHFDLGSVLKVGFMKVKKNKYGLLITVMYLDYKTKQFGLCDIRKFTIDQVSEWFKDCKMYSVNFFTEYSYGQYIDDIIVGEFYAMFKRRNYINPTNEAEKHNNYLKLKGVPLPKFFFDLDNKKEIELIEIPCFDHCSVFGFRKDTGILKPTSGIYTNHKFLIRQELLFDTEEDNSELENDTITRTSVLKFIDKDHPEIQTKKVNHLFVRRFINQMFEKSQEKDTPF